MSLENESQVIEFYNKKTVFITGATGFMGKVLLEKLLRCTNVTKVFILMRPKKDLDTDMRLKELLSSVLFDRVRELDATRLDIVEVIEGNIMEDSLGISEVSEKKLIESVNLIFHSAATVRFDEDLTTAIAMNVTSVSMLISLARKMKYMNGFVHVSTAFANCDKPIIEEMIYPSNIDPKALSLCCKLLEKQKVNNQEVMKAFIGEHPNTYTYSKFLGETVVLTEGKGLPIVIIRPSIVSASWKEPFEGWVDNYNGPSGIVALAGSGIMRTLYCKRTCVADMIPVDVCINLMVLLGWEVATQVSDSIEVYNCTSSAHNPITWGEFESFGRRIIDKYPYESVFWYPGGSYKENWYYNRFCELAFHYGPAHLVDLGCWLTGHKPFLVKISNKIQQYGRSMEFFTTTSWQWTCQNMIMLEKKLSPEERKLFFLDIRTDFEWMEYLEIYMKGVRKFLFKSDPSTFPASRRRLLFLYWIDVVFKVALVIGMLYLYTLVFKRVLAFI